MNIALCLEGLDIKMTCLWLLDIYDANTETPFVFLYFSNNSTARPSFKNLYDLFYYQVAKDVKSMFTFEK